MYKNIMRGAWGLGYTLKLSLSGHLLGTFINWADHFTVTWQILILRVSSYNVLNLQQATLQLIENQNLGVNHQATPVFWSHFQPHWVLWNLLDEWLWCCIVIIFSNLNVYIHVMCTCTSCVTSVLCMHNVVLLFICHFECEALWVMGDSKLWAGLGPRWPDEGGLSVQWYPG